MIHVGFWKDTRYPDFPSNLPDPRELADPAWYGDGWAERIAGWLDRGQVVEKWLGDSYCRFGCEKAAMGSKDLSDGIYLWPEGLSHYVRVHGVVLPRKFIRHILEQMIKEGSLKL